MALNEFGSYIDTSSHQMPKSYSIIEHKQAAQSCLDASVHFFYTIYIYKQAHLRCMPMHMKKFLIETKYI